jgi:tetratricopeptide (TPR) repeat protein
VSSLQNLNPEVGQLKFLCEAGMLLASKGKYAEACDIFHGLIAISPQRSIGYTMLGDAIMNLGKFDEAIKWHLKAVELEPNNTFARVHLGETFLFLKQKDKGLTELRKVLEQDPNGLDGTLARHLIRASDQGIFSKV